MNILVCGATGFVGRHLTQRLRDGGHSVFRGVRRPTQSGDIAINFCTDTAKEIWVPRLHGIDVVINAVGVLRDSAEKPMWKLHGEAPQALFLACAETSVQRIVQFSALGIDDGIDTLYFQTRRAAEASLRAAPQNINWLILRPALIYGEDGASARLFRLLARMPVHLLHMGGLQRLQPVHINDISAAVKRWLNMPHPVNQIISAAGPEATTLRAMLDSYRAQMLRPRAWHVGVPTLLIKAAARMGDFIPASPFCSDTLTMLAAGNTGDATDFTELLGYTPRSYCAFIQQGSSGCTQPT